MNSGKMVFSQIMDCLPWWRFHSIVKQYRGNHKSKHFFCVEHFRVMAFAQLTHRKSLRDVEAAFDAIGKKAYHMGIKCKIAKSTLADANEQRNWKIYADFSQVLIAQARKLYADEPLDVQWDGAVYAIDAITIDLGLSVLCGQATDFQRLYLFNQAEASIVSLLKKSTLWKRRYSHEIDKTAGIRSDQTIVLTGKETRQNIIRSL